MFEIYDGVSVGYDLDEQVYIYSNGVAQTVYVELKDFICWMRFIENIFTDFKGEKWQKIGSCHLSLERMDEDWYNFCIEHFDTKIAFAIEKKTIIDLLSSLEEDYNKTAQNKLAKGQNNA